MPGNSREGKSYWYEPILPSESTFPLSCRLTLVDFITSVASHLSNKRTADTFLQFLINSSSITIVFLNELSAAFQVSGGSTSPELMVNRYLELCPDSSLANVLASGQQHKKLRMVADDILSAFLDPKVYGCIPARDFFREMLAGVVFESTISSLSRPEFINGWIIHLFSEGESEIMNAIDAGVEGARNQGVTLSNSPGGERNQPLDFVDKATPGSPSHSGPGFPKLNHADSATRDAMAETKRLSDMMAAHDAQDQNLEQGSYVTPGAGIHQQRSDSATTVLPSTIDTAQSPANRQPENPKPNSTEQSRDSYGSLYTKHSDPSTHLGNYPPLHTTPERIPEPPRPSGETNGAPLTLLGASVSVDDGSQPDEKGTIKSRPASDYLLQIEPATSRCTGWMVFRKYADFESLHETLDTISRLNRIQTFMDQHPILPPWKGQTKMVLMRNLEQYLRDALQHGPLADSEKMKRFLEKGTRLGNQNPSAPIKPGLLFNSQTSFENMSRGVLDALSNAPKGVAGGGKAVFEGVSGALGNVAASKRNPFFVSKENEQGPRIPSFDHMAEEVPSLTPGTEDRPPGEARDSSALDSDSSAPAEYAELPNDRRRSDPSRNRVGDSTTRKLATQDGASSSPGVANHRSSDDFSDDSVGDPCKASVGSLPQYQGTKPETCFPSSPTRVDKAKKPNNSITSEETQIAVELIFAVINELYSMSSVWNIRKTLLNAAKSYILRPGSPNLETIRSLLQDSMIDAHTSDETLAYYLLKLRENALPTEGEFNKWPPPPSDAEKERLRETARKLFVQRGIPQALMSVMGATASREALEKVFDCLQVETIARGLVFSVLMQALRAVIL